MPDLTGLWKTKDEIKKWLDTFKAKDFETASKLGQEVLTLDSTRTDIYETIAKGYYDAGQYDKAIVAYDTKIAKTKATTTDYFYIAQSYMTLKNYPSAEIAFGKLTDLSPTYLFAWAQRAKIAEMGDPELKTGGGGVFAAFPSGIPFESQLKTVVF